MLHAEGWRMLHARDWEAIGERRRALAERLTDGMALYRGNGTEPVPVRLPDGTVTTTVPLATRCEVADPPPGATAYFLGVVHRGSLVALATMPAMQPGDSFELPVNSLFTAT